jgi:hypothetical protein
VAATGTDTGAAGAAGTAEVAEAAAGVVNVRHFARVTRDFSFCLSGKEGRREESTHSAEFHNLKL